MALIKTDPSQTKMVVALVGVLAVAVGVTAVRLKPQPAAQAAAQSQQAQSSAAPVDVGPAPAANGARNPFEKPAGLAAAPVAEEDGQPGGPSGETELPPRGANPWTSMAQASVEPVDLRPVMPADSAKPGSSKPAKSTEPAPAEPDKGKSRPAFTLLATVKGERGYSAVIKTGSSVRVVEIGDLVEGGFRVLTLENWRAVLSDGRETIVAKRPQ